MIETKTLCENRKRMTNSYVKMQLDLTTNSVVTHDVNKRGGEFHAVEHNMCELLDPLYADRIWRKIKQIIAI